MKTFFLRKPKSLQGTNQFDSAFKKQEKGISLSSWIRKGSVVCMYKRYCYFRYVRKIECKGDNGLRQVRWTKHSSLQSRLSSEQCITMENWRFVCSSLCNISFDWVTESKPNMKFAKSLKYKEISIRYVQFIEKHFL